MTDSIGLSDTGSTAEIAKWLRLPVLLCADARSMARSLAALALGFVRFDPESDLGRTGGQSCRQPQS